MSIYVSLSHCNTGGEIVELTGSVSRLREFRFRSMTYWDVGTMAMIVAVPIPTSKDCCEKQTR